MMIAKNEKMYTNTQSWFSYTKGTDNLTKDWNSEQKQHLENKVTDCETQVLILLC